MISVVFNEREWQFEVLNTGGKVLAAVYDEGQAENLQRMYKSMEEQEQEIQQQEQQEQEMAEMAWRVEDNKGGE